MIARSTHRRLLVLTFLTLAIAGCPGGGDGTLRATIDSPSNVTIQVGEAVVFEGSVRNGTAPYTFSWQFDSAGIGGGPADSSEEDPGSVTFSTPGTFTVTFTVADSLGETDSDTLTVTVTPGNGGGDPAHYPNASDWGQYVTDDGTGPLDASGALCDSAAGLPCLHGGEMRSLALGSLTSCAGVNLADDLDAFDWVCDDTGGAVRAISTGLKAGRLLSDLIDFSAPGWRPNAVQATGCASCPVSSASSVWWSNPVVVDNDGLPSADAVAGTVYLVTTSGAADFTLAADSISLVVQPGAAITDGASGQATTVRVTAPFSWIEGTIEAGGHPSSLSIDSDGYAVVRNVQVTGGRVLVAGNFCRIAQLVVQGSPGVGLELPVSNCVIQDVTVTGSVDAGVVVSGRDNLLERITSRDNFGSQDESHGIRLSGEGTILIDATVEDNADSGLLIEGSGMTVTGVLARGNFWGGVVTSSISFDNTLDDILAFDNQSADPGGLWIQGTNNRISNVQAYRNLRDGIWVTGSGNRLSNLQLSNNFRDGLRVSGWGSVIWNVTATNNNSEGVNFHTTAAGPLRNNLIANVTAANNGLNGLVLHRSGNGILQNITVINHWQNGLSYAGSGIVFEDSSPENTLQNLSAVNNEVTGLDFRSGTAALPFDLANYVFNNSAIANNTTWGIRLTRDSHYSRFTGLLLVGGNGLAATEDCFTSSSAIEPGLDTNCNAQFGSDASVTTPIGTPTWVGKVSLDDGLNTSDNNAVDGLGGGRAVFENIEDWTAFDNPFRGWGKEGTGFPNLDNMGPCLPGEDCRIWDWSLSASDTVTLGVVPLPTGDDTLTHRFTADQTTCADLGAVWDGPSSTCSITFLRNAVEIMDDGEGNENTLCESGETCLYTPNIGSYQGHGGLVSAGAFIGGLITGVTLMRYETNGY